MSLHVTAALKNRERQQYWQYIHIKINNIQNLKKDTVSLYDIDT